MTYAIDLLSIQTPTHLRHGWEHRTQFDCGDFEINIFETFQSSTKVKIRHDGLSISSMIRGSKTVYAKDGKSFEFLPGTTLILPDGETIYADFPEADQKNPVQCATILIHKSTIEKQLDDLSEHYRSSLNSYDLDFSNYHFNNNSALARAFNELLQIATNEYKHEALSDLSLKTLLIRITEAQSENFHEQEALHTNSKLYNVKKFIKENLSKTIKMDALTEIGNCSKSTLHRLFATYCGKTPGAYILHERMIKARNLLLQPQASISEVAYASGFSSVSYFVHQFKLFHDCTPGNFIKKFGRTTNPDGLINPISYR